MEKKSKMELTTDWDDTWPDGYPSQRVATLVVNAARSGLSADP